MIAYAELERAITRWKARRSGAQPAETVAESVTTEFEDGVPTTYGNVPEEASPDHATSSGLIAVEAELDDGA
jgi:hypothetical protein